MAYTNELRSKTPVKGTSSTRLAFTFTSDTPESEPTFDAEFVFRPGMTVDDLGAWLWEQEHTVAAHKALVDALVVGEAVAAVKKPDPSIEVIEVGEVAKEP